MRRYQTTPIRGFGNLMFAELLAVLAVAACSSGGPVATPGGATATRVSATGTITATTTGAASTTACPQKGVKELTGAGSTFVYPLASKMFDQYNKLCNVKVNYQSIGSGGGISQLQKSTVDFAGTDAIMNEQQRTQAQGGAVLHIPVAAGAEAIIFNLAGIRGGQLKLTSDILADIYLKKVTRWNDPRIAAVNEGVTVPSTDIAVVHRSDGSGTTFIFTDYLSKVSPDWKRKVGSATSVNWPGDIGGQGNEGVANQVKAKTGQKARALFHPIRIALTGRAEGPELDLAVPAIDSGADLPASAGIPNVMGCRERAAAFVEALGKST